MKLHYLDDLRPLFRPPGHIPRPGQPAKTELSGRITFALYISAWWLGCLAILGDLLQGDWAGLQGTLTTFAGLNAGGAGALWVLKANERWYRRTVARLEAERKSLEEATQ